MERRPFPRALRVLVLLIRPILVVTSKRDWQGEQVLRKHHATAQIDPRTFAYLVENVRIELQMAHERLTG